MDNNNYVIKNPDGSISYLQPSESSAIQAVQLQNQTQYQTVNNYIAPQPQQLPAPPLAQYLPIRYYPQLLVQPLGFNFNSNKHVLCPRCNQRLIQPPTPVYKCPCGQYIQYS